MFWYRNGIHFVKSEVATLEVAETDTLVQCIEQMPTTREASPCWDKLITTSWSSTATAISQHIGWYLRDESATWAIWPYPYWHGRGRQSHFTVWGRGYITWKVKPISHTPIDLPNRVVGITKSHIARKMNERPRESRVIDRAKNGPLIHQVMRLGVFVWCSFLQRGAFYTFLLFSKGGLATTAGMLPAGMRSAGL